MIAGALAGYNSGSVSNVSASGTISVTPASGSTVFTVGGLVGVNNTGATIEQSHASVDVSVTALTTIAIGFTGGLVGLNQGAIRQSFATGNVTGGGSSGGLVGYNLAVNGDATISQSYATGNVTGGFAGVGGLVGANFASGATASVTESYSTGLVTPGSGGLGYGGLVGFNFAVLGGTAAVSNSYWDTQTSGRATSAGGTGLTTAQLQAALPSGWDTNVWSIVAGQSYPYFLWQFPTGPQVVAGFVYTDHGVTSAGGGVVVSGVLNGTPLSSITTGGSVTTGANGYYNFLLPLGTISPTGSQVLTYTTGPNAGAAFQQNATASIYNLDIYGGYLHDVTSGGTLSALNTARSTAIGSNPTLQTLVNGLPNRQIDALGPTFQVDALAQHSTLVLVSSGAVTQAASSNATIAASNLVLLGAGGSFTLNNTAGTGNQVDTLAANTGAVSFTNGRNLTIGSAAGVNGVTTTGAFTLNANGHSIGAPAPVSAGLFTLAGGDWVQNSASLPAFSATDFRITGGSFLRVTGGDGSAGNPYKLADVYGLEGVRSPGFNNKSFTLASDIDATGTAGWNSGAGYLPITASSGFAFDGANHTIDGLTIASAQSPAGLFGFIQTGATVSNLNLAHVNIGATGNTMFLGALAGDNSGTVNNVHVLSGSVSGGLYSGIGAGGLVGQNESIISGSSAAVAVTVGNAASQSSINTSGGLVGTNLGTITTSSASGDVSGGANVYVGGLVGQNGLLNFGTGAITSSFATGKVTVTGLNSAAGGLAGSNAAGSIITDSQATGAVAGSANGSDTQSRIVAGGLVGQNAGTITSTTTPSAASSCATGASFSCATGNVSVGMLGHGGGLVGNNQGTIAKSFATGAVTGAPGMAASGGNDFQTQLGGLAANNQGTITDLFARGNVGAAGVPYLSVGGLVGDNSGTILRSFATGTVQTGDHGDAGGLVASNGPCDNCNFGVNGTGQNNAGLIQDLHASGAVSVGAQSIAGGLMGDGNGTITNASATGAVTGAGGSLLGGLAGASDATITTSSASGAVTSQGDASIVGGLVGGNLGSISGSSASGAVTGGTNAVIGGLVGFNPGSIANSFATGNVTGGSGSFVGGLVGWNIGGEVTNAQFSAFVGKVTGSHATGNVTGGDNSIAGGFFGVNLFGAIDTVLRDRQVSGGAGSTVGGFGGLNIGTVNVALVERGGRPAATTVSSAASSGSISRSSIPTSRSRPARSRRPIALGAGTGGANSFVAGFAAINVGSLDQTYAGGLVTGGPGSTTGGLVASNTFSYTLPAVDRAPRSARHRHQLLLGPPDHRPEHERRRHRARHRPARARPAGGFDPAVWGTIGGQYPFLAGARSVRHDAGHARAASASPPVQPVTSGTCRSRQVQPTTRQSLQYTPVTATTPAYHRRDHDHRHDVPPLTPGRHRRRCHRRRPRRSWWCSRSPGSRRRTNDALAEVVNTQAITQAQQASSRANSSTAQPASRAGATQRPASARRRSGSTSARAATSTCRRSARPALVKNEAVLQLPCNVAGAALAAATRQLRLTVMSSQCLGHEHAVYRVQIGSGQTLEHVLRALAAYRIIVAAQANYLYALAQEPTAAPAGASARGRPRAIRGRQAAPHRGAPPGQGHQRPDRGDRFGDRRHASRSRGRDRRPATTPPAPRKSRIRTAPAWRAPSARTSG